MEANIAELSQLNMKFTFEFFQFTTDSQGNKQFSGSLHLAFL
jgi:hypothetical protein